MPDFQGLKTEDADLFMPTCRIPNGLRQSTRRQW